MTDLKPCPFCGGEVERGYFAEEFVVNCPKCRFEVSTCDDDGPDDHSVKGIKHWNTRTEPTPVQVWQEAMEAVAGEAERYASHYKQNSDGRNTFVLFADAVRNTIPNPYSEESK